METKLDKVLLCPTSRNSQLKSLPPTHTTHTHAHTIHPFLSGCAWTLYVCVGVRCACMICICVFPFRFMYMSICDWMNTSEIQLLHSPIPSEVCVYLCFIYILVAHKRISAFKGNTQKSKARARIKIGLTHIEAKRAGQCARERQRHGVAHGETSQPIRV